MRSHLFRASIPVLFLTIVTAACGSSSSSPSSSAPLGKATSSSPADTQSGSSSGNKLTVTTPDGTVFDPNQLTAPANTTVTITYENDSTLPHDLHVFAGTDASGKSLGATPVDTGPDSVHTLKIKTGASGTYFFHCDVHPDTMTGTITIG